MSSVTVMLAIQVPSTAGAVQVSAGPPVIVCTVAGYDVIIHNTGTDPIVSGTPVDWSVPFARKQGSHLLTGELEPGGRVFLSGILSPSWMEPGGDCEASMGGTSIPSETEF